MRTPPLKEQSEHPNFLSKETNIITPQIEKRPPGHQSTPTTSCQSRCARTVIIGWPNNPDRLASDSLSNPKQHPVQQKLPHHLQWSLVNQNQKKCIPLLSFLDREKHIWTTKGSSHGNPQRPQNNWNTSNYPYKSKSTLGPEHIHQQPPESSHRAFLYILLLRLYWACCEVINNTGNSLYIQLGYIYITVTTHNMTLYIYVTYPVTYTIGLFHFF
mgnify:CR=1 FL=1